jgi:hypothetical protein
MARSIHMTSTVARDAIAVGIAALVTVGDACAQTVADEPISQADRGASARDPQARSDGEATMFKYKYQDDSTGGLISIRESMVDEASGVELEPAGLAPPNIVKFQYKDKEISFQFSTYRDKSEELSDTVIVGLGYGLSRIRPESKRAEISVEKIREISHSIEEALQAWPASSGWLNYPSSYLNEKIPIRHVKFIMVGWEGGSQQ